MIKKISLILIILLLATSVAYADKNIDDLKIPHDFSEKKEEGYFFMKAYDNPRFIISEYNESSSPFKNSTFYEFWPSDNENIFYFSNHQVSDIGAVELVKIDNKEYTVSVLYASTIKDEDYLQKSVDYLEEFNQMNNLKPVKP